MAGRKKGARVPPRDLTDMRDVYLGKVREDNAKNPGQRAYVQFLKEDPTKFLEKKRELEAKWFQTTQKVKPAEAAKVTAPSQVVRDDGEERARGMLEMLDGIEDES